MGTTRGPAECRNEVHPVTQPINQQTQQLRYAMNKLPFIVTAVTVLWATGCQQTRMQVPQSRSTAAAVPETKAPAPAPAPGYGPTYATFEEGGVLWKRGSMAFPTGLRESSGLLVEKTLPAEVLVGQKFDYAYKLSNLTDYPIHMVTLADRVSANFTSAEVDPKPSDTRDGVATWQLGTLGPKETKTIRVKGSSAEEGTVTTCGWATYSPLLCEDVRVVKAALQLTKNAPAEVILCDPIPMTLTVKNAGSSGLTGVKVSDALPQGLTSDGKSALSWDIGNLAPGESKEIKFNSAASATGKYVNAAKATSAQGVQAEASSTTVVREPALAITCTAPEQRYMGRPFEVCFSVVNKGDAVAAASVLEVPIPAGATFKSATAGGQATASAVVWNLGALAPNAPKEVCATFVSAEAGAFKFVGAVKGVCAKPATTTCQTLVVGVSALLLEKADDPDPIAVGETTTYTVKVTNQGTADDTNIRMVVEFPAEIAPVSASNGGVVEGRRVTFPAFPRLTPKQAFTYTIKAKGEKVGDARVRFVRTSDGIPAPTSAEESTRVY